MTTKSPVYNGELIVIDAQTELPQTGTLETTTQVPQPHSSWFAEPPPAFVSWAATAIAVISALWTLFVYIEQKRETKLRDQRDREDAYWFRSVVLPDCLKSLSTFREECIASLRELEYRLTSASSMDDCRICYGAFMRDFQRKKAAAHQGMLALSLFGKDLYDECADCLDDLDDQVQQSLAVQILGQNCGPLLIDNQCDGANKAYVDAIAVLKRQHAKLFN